jgi:multidrug efflux pump subunit AcrA (membrane-fusion protein)
LNATVTVTGGQAQNVLLVPVAALKSLGNQQYTVTVVGSDGQKKQQTVTVGLQNAEYAEVTSGLKQGDVISTGTTQTSIGSNSSKNNTNGGGMPPDGGMPPMQ